MSEYLNISSTKVRDIIKSNKKNESDNDFTNIKNFLTDDVTEEIRRIKYEKAYYDAFLRGGGGN